MRKIMFEDDEMRVIAMFDTSNRQAAQKEIEAVIPFTQDDPELSAVVINTAEKLKQVTDKDFSELDFDRYLAEVEDDYDDESGEDE